MSNSVNRLTSFEDAVVNLTQVKQKPLSQVFICTYVRTIRIRMISISVYNKSFDRLSHSEYLTIVAVAAKIEVVKLSRSSRMDISART